MGECKVVTMGCRFAFESEVIKGHIHKAKLENIIVINSCAVTQEAERQTRQKIIAQNVSTLKADWSSLVARHKLILSVLQKCRMFTRLSAMQKSWIKFWLDLSGH